MSKYIELSEQAKTVFFAELAPRKDELLATPIEDAITEIAEELGTACDTVLNEKKLGYTKYHALLLQCCMEDMSLFSVQPGAIECIRESGGDDLTAAHCVYHNLYDSIHASLEQEFEDWHYANQPQESEGN